MAEVVIIGAGLTGLSTAYHLEQQGFFDFKIFEKNDRPGGLLQSVEQDGFVFDHTGHLLHVNDAYFKAFLDTIAGIHNFNIIERRSAIYSHNAYTDYPFQMNLYGLPISVIAECIEGYLSRKTNLKNPHSFYDWVLKYFGTGFGKYFFFPYNQKLLAYNLKQVHHSWTGRFVPQTNLTAILQGALEKKPAQGIGYNSSFYYPKSGGIEFIIKRLAQHVITPILTKFSMQSIDLKNRIITFENGHHEHFQTLITTVPLNILLRQLQEKSHTTVKRAEKKLTCNTVININLGLDRESISDKHWIYFPEKKFPLYRIGFWNNLSKSSSRPGCSAIYGELSYLPGTKTPRQIISLTDHAKNAILAHFDLKHSNIVTQKNLTLNHAYVIYDQWREKNLKNLLVTLEEQSIHSVGRFGEWKYSSMQEAVLDGKRVAEKIVATRTKAVSKREQPFMQQAKKIKLGEIAP